MEHRWNGTFIKFRDVLQKFVDKFSLFSRNFTSKTFPCFQLRYSRKKISCRHIFHIMLILCEKFDSLCAASASITRLVIILSNRLYILLYNQSSIICGLKEREAATKASKSIQLNARLLLLCSLPLMWIWYACKFAWLLSIFYGYRWDLNVDIIEKIILGMFVMLHYCVAIEIKFGNVEIGVNAFAIHAWCHYDNDGVVDSQWG